jgi:NodT family efflux transporter outer membrane factor (OMF) lipoprotein
MPRLNALDPLKSLTTLAAAALLGACSLTPTYERPAAPVPAQFPQAGAVPEAAAPVADLAWADFLGDERLRALVQQALENNRDLRVATLNVAQVRAQLGLQRAERWPTVGAGLQASSTPGGGGNERVYSAGLQVSGFEADLFGRVRSLSDAAAARLLASEEGRRAAQVALVAAVASTELALRADAALLQITESTLAARQESLRLSRLRFEGGVAAEPELRAAESLLAAAQASLAALQRQQAGNRNALALLLGQGPQAALPSALQTPPALEATALRALPLGLSSEVLLQRPDILQAEQTLRAANANIGAARAAFFPRITLTGSLGLASGELRGLFDNTAWSFTGQLLQPLFDAGRNQANLAAAQAGREIAVAQYEKAIQQAFREVADALAGRATLGEQLAAQQALARAETRRAELARLLFEGGAASALERLDAERAALTAQQAVVQLQLAQLQNQVLLYQVLGGGAGPALGPAPQAAVAR